MAKVVVRVEGGLVQAAYSTDPSIELEVIDLDVSNFSDAEGEREAEASRRRLDEIEQSPDWHPVW